MALEDLIYKRREERIETTTTGGVNNPMPEALQGVTKARIGEVLRVYGFVENYYYDDPSGIPYLSKVVTNIDVDGLDKGTGKRQ